MTETVKLVMVPAPDPGVFRATADVLRENGWFQGDFVAPFVDDDKPRGMDLSGALRFVVNGNAWQPSEASDAVETWLVAYCMPSGYFEQVEVGSLGGCAEALGDWNDRKSRTFDDVLDLLTRAASAAESALAAQDGGES